jgi:hypothetical protein
MWKYYVPLRGSLAGRSGHAARSNQCGALNAAVKGDTITKPGTEPGTK